MIEGVIIKGVGGAYTVSVAEGTLVCNARGVFRNRQVTPVIGDRVTVINMNTTEMTGTIQDILPRRNELRRPRVANVDQVIVTVSAAKPIINPDLLDKYLMLVEFEGIPAVLCINKSDLATRDTSGGESLDALIRLYESVGYSVVFASAETGEGLETLRGMARQKISVFAGPSGVGKSSLINALAPKAGRETGTVSVKIERGRHTTRHTELISLPPAEQDDSGRVGGFTHPEAVETGGLEGAVHPGLVIDTPGFTSLDLSVIPPERLASLFREFVPYLGGCRFNNCRHDNEIDCSVKAQVGRSVHPERYARYVAALRKSIIKPGG